MRNKKILHGLMVGVICLGIILAGAFAWFSFTQQALNIFEGWTNPDVNLHDDFDPDVGDKDVYVENSGKRPLYVRVKFDEYMEIDDQNIIEAANLGRDAFEQWYVHTYVGTGGPEYSLPPESLNGVSFQDYYDWIMGNAAGDPNNGWKYYVPAPFEKRALFDATGLQLRNPQTVMYEDAVLFWANVPKTDKNPADADYYTDLEMRKVTKEELYNWLEYLYAQPHGLDLAETPAGTAPLTLNYVSGAGVAQFASTAANTTNLDYVNWLYSVIDRDYSALSGTARTNAEKDKVNATAALNAFLTDKELGYTDYTYEVNPGNTYQSMALDSADFGDLYIAGNEDSDLINEKQVFVPIKRTQVTSTVYTMSQWIAAGTPIGDFWIMDTDGWCYWANVLLPGQSTGLLLSEVLLNELNPPNGVWWYGINVSLQAVTVDDIPKLAMDPTSVEAQDGGGGVTEQGQMVLDAVSGTYVYGVSPSAVAGGKVDPAATIYTYRKFGDNTYRMMTSDGSEIPYAPLFVYTGTTGSKVSDMTALYNRFYPVADNLTNNPVTYTFIDNSVYSIGYSAITPVDAQGNSLATIPAKAPTGFWMIKEIDRTEIWDYFTVIDAGYGSGVIEAANGRRYIKLGYGVYNAGNQTYDANGGWEKAAWLSVGPNGVFDALVANNTLDAALKVPDGTSVTNGAGSKGILSADLVSRNDDVLIWTDGGIPGTGSDRFTETITTPEVKIGDSFTIDSIEWVVLGTDKNDHSSNQDNMLLISKDVLESVQYGSGATTLDGIVAEYDESKLANLAQIHENAKDGEIEGTLLSIQEAIDYFANNAARSAVLTNTENANDWWLDDGVVAANGALSGHADGGPNENDEHGLRIAVWVNSENLKEYLNVAEGDRATWITNLPDSQ